MKLIASDYDGTLNRNGVQDHVSRAIDDWQAAGNKFGVVSGRGMPSLLWVMEKDPVICDFLIANNGAVLADGKGNVISYHHRDAGLCGEIVPFVLEHQGKYAIVCFAENEFYVVRDEQKARHADDGKYQTADTYTPSAFTQISTVSETRSEAMQLAEAINREFAGKVTALVNGRSIDIVPYGVDKAEGIRELCALWKLDTDAVRTVGDNYNDEAMIRAFTSYAVENAVEEIKALATYVVCDIAELCERETAEQS